jgi:hypothetical protein
MPEEKKEKEVQNEQMVDLDTSGPEVDVALPQEKEQSVEQEVTNAETDNKDGDKSDDSSEKPDEQLDATPSEPEAKKETPEEGDSKPADDSSPVEEYSAGVKKRIAKLTKRMREAERQREEAVSYAKRVQGERDQLTRVATDLDKNYADEMEGRISSSLAAAQAKLAAAREQSDAKAEVEALTAISQLGYEQGKLAEIKTQHKMEETAAKKETSKLDRPVRARQTPPPDPKAEAWAEKNEWFGKDNAMTYTAFDLHRKLTEEEGIDPKSDEYYEEVDKRIRLEFPHKFGNKNVVEKTTSKPTQNVASATRSSRTAGRKTVRLTPSQVAIAKKLGVPLEEYAKQLINTQEA